ncbi:hypothetical protein VCHC21A1_0238, partial [Vibrio cholerae HC-21A1]|jgi:hypothetical protein
MRLLL